MGAGINLEPHAVLSMACVGKGSRVDRATSGAVIERYRDILRAMRRVPLHKHYSTTALQINHGRTANHGRPSIVYQRVPLLSERAAWGSTMSRYYVHGSHMSQKS